MKRNQTMKRQSHDLEFLMLGKSKKKDDISKRIELNEDNRSTSTILLPNEKKKLEKVLQDARSKTRNPSKLERHLVTPMNKLIPKTGQLGNNSEFSFRVIKVSFFPLSNILYCKDCPLKN